MFIDPVSCLLDSGEERLLIILTDLTTEALLVIKLSLYPVNERRQRVEGLDTLALKFILFSYKMSKDTVMAK